MISLACVPAMLIFKPLILFFQLKSKAPAKQHKYDVHEESAAELNKKLK